MSDQEELELNPGAVGRLTGKTTTHSVQILFSDPKVERNSYFVIYGKEIEEGTRPSYILNITEMWSEPKGMMAKLQVLGDRPSKPFEMGTEAFLATEEQISKVLGIYNPPEKSVSLGKLIGYPFDVNLLVKNFGRIFITGKSGSGKSYTMGVLCEEFMKKGIPVVILDRHGEYGSLKVASEELEKEVPASFEVKSGFCPWCGEEIPKDSKNCKQCGKSLESEISEMPKTKDPDASEFVEKIIEYADMKMNKSADVDIEYLFSLESTDIVAPNLCSIINMRGLNLEVQEVIASKLLKKLYQASTNREIPPFYLFLDEAHLFAGKKQTETCEIVKLFAQEGRKFGANIVIGTQRPQLLDVTIRAQSGTWVVHNLSDIRDIGITIQSAEDLSRENSSDISGLDKGQGIICGEAVKGIPLFIKVRKRRTKHGGVGFNPLDFLSEQTVSELQKRKDKILGNKSEEVLESSKSMYQEMMKPKTTVDFLEENTKLKDKIKDLEKELAALKLEQAAISKDEGISVSDDNSESIKELKTQIQVWKEKYNYLKQKADSEIPQTSGASDEEIAMLKNDISSLHQEVNKWRNQYESAKKLAEKTIAELKRKK
ncbi:MAG: helicase HerA domain-containing protein [Candidatus Hodarchaeota archaeon]